MPFVFENYYYLILLLQGICVLHSIKKGNQQKWIWLIVFLPVIGCIAYIYTEMNSRQGIASASRTVGNIINPGGSIKELERKLAFTDTFENKKNLASAYLQRGQTDQAIELFESCLKGVFHDNEFVLSRLLEAYYEKERYSDAIAQGEKLSGSEEFQKSHAHVLYAWALEKSGHRERAEREFSRMTGRFSGFEGRVNNAQFLIGIGKEEEARHILEEILNEASFMNGAEKRSNSSWISQAKVLLKNFE